MNGKSIIAGLMLLVFFESAVAGVLERTRETGVFRIGYRSDAAPLSYKNDIGEPAGYSVSLCRRIASAVREAIGVTAISVEYVAVGRGTGGRAGPDAARPRGRHQDP